MQLYLVHNDPLHTLLVTSDGEPLYSIQTPTQYSLDSYSSSPLSLHLQSRLAPSSPASDHSSSSGSSLSIISSVSSGSTSPTSTTSTSPPPLSPFTPTISSPPPLLSSRSLSHQFTGASQNEPSHTFTHHRPSPSSHPSSPITIAHPDSHSQGHHPYPNSSIPSVPHPKGLVSEFTPPVSPTTPSAAPGSVTTVRRLLRHNSSRGNVETEVGRVEYSGEHIGTRVQLCHSGMEICAPPVERSGGSGTTSPPTSKSQSISRSTEVRGDAVHALAAFQDYCEQSKQRKGSTKKEEDFEEETFIPDPTWEFIGPDNRPYKWLSLARCPVLVHNTQPMPAPLARYRPAKLGIISRSQRGFLEILPGGLENEDMIVVTFVGYFRMKMGNAGGRARTLIPRTPSASPPLPPPNRETFGMRRSRVGSEKHYSLLG